MAVDKSVDLAKKKVTKGSGEKKINKENAYYEHGWCSFL